MSKVLITQSLVSAHDYMFSCFDDAREQAEADFLRVLNREPGEQTQAMLDGIAFETLCYNIADGKFCPMLDGSGKQLYPSGYNGASQIAEIIRGGQYQVSASREFVLDGVRFVVYGKLDVLKAGVIFDIKHKSKALSRYDIPGLYFQSPQHPFYLYAVPAAYRFEYLVSDGEDVYTETYLREDTPPVTDILEGFRQSMLGMGLWDLYCEKWKSKY